MSCTYMFKICLHKNPYMCTTFYRTYIQYSGLHYNTACMCTIMYMYVCVYSLLQSLCFYVSCTSHCAGLALIYMDWEHGILTHLQHYVVQNYTDTLCDYDNTYETQELMCIVLCPYKLPKLIYRVMEWMIIITMPSSELDTVAHSIE